MQLQQFQINLFTKPPYCDLKVICHKLWNLPVSYVPNLEHEWQHAWANIVDLVQTALYEQSNQGLHYLLPCLSFLIIYRNWICFKFTYTIIGKGVWVHLHVHFSKLTFSKLNHFVWSDVPCTFQSLQKATWNTKYFLTKGQSYYTQTIFQQFSNSANTSTKLVSPSIVMHIVKVFENSESFQEVSFTRKYVLFLNTFGACYFIYKITYIVHKEIYWYSK